MTHAVDAGCGAPAHDAAAERPALPPAAAPIDGVLLVAFGGPEGPEDVVPFLRNVTAGRDIPEQRLIEVSGHYRTMGGVSPINDQCRMLRAQLEAELAARGLALPVMWGNRNWHPLIADTLAAAAEAGHRHLVALAVSAYASYSSCRQYREDLAAAMNAGGLLARVAIDKIPPFFQLPGFMAPFEDGIVEQVGQLRRFGLELEEIEVVFTTHSIPTALAASSGVPSQVGDEAGGVYVAQHEQLCRHLVAKSAARLDCSPAQLQHRLCYQSRSGSPHTPWLEPDISEALAQVARAGRRAVVVVPIGFVSDHVEVYWDLDVVARECALDLGLAFRRVATPGTDPRFVAGLADLVAAHVAHPQGATCPAQCCRHPRTRRASLAGADSAQDWAADSAVAGAWTPEQLAASGIAGGANLASTP